MSTPLVLIATLAAAAALVHHVRTGPRFGHAPESRNARGFLYYAVFLFGSCSLAYTANQQFHAGAIIAIALIAAHGVLWFVATRD